MMNRRVVVTGLGMVSPIGNDVASSWKAALEGKSGIDRITAFDASAFGCQIAGDESLPERDCPDLQHQPSAGISRGQAHLRHGNHPFAWGSS